MEIQRHFFRKQKIFQIWPKPFHSMSFSFLFYFKFPVIGIPKWCGAGSMNSSPGHKAFFGVQPRGCISFPSGPPVSVTKRTEQIFFYMQGRVVLEGSACNLRRTLVAYTWWTYYASRRTGGGFWGMLQHQSTMEWQCDWKFPKQKNEKRKKRNYF